MQVGEQRPSRPSTRSSGTSPVLDHGHVGAEPAPLPRPRSRSSPRRITTTVPRARRPRAGVGVGERPQVRDAVAAAPGDRRAPRHRAGGDQQPVVVQLLRRRSGHGARRVEPGRHGAGQQLDRRARRRTPRRARSASERLGSLRAGSPWTAAAARTAGPAPRGDEDDAPGEALLAQRLRPWRRPGPRRRSRTSGGQTLDWPSRQGQELLARALVIAQAAEQRRGPCAPALRTPRSDMHRCSASSTTPTPLGARWSSSQSAICVVSAPAPAGGGRSWSTTARAWTGR